MQKYNVIFLGTTDFSTTILENLAKESYINLSLIITQPDRPQGRNKKIIKSPVKLWAEKHQMSLQQPTNLKTLTPLIKQLKPDFLISAAYGQIIPLEILNLAKIEALNVHGSFLPKHRGGSPIQTAILNGDLESGVSIIRMVKAMDAGPIFGQVKLKIDPNLTGGELIKQAAIAGSQLLNKLILPIAKNEIKPWAQNIEQVSFAYNIKPEQERINWTQSAKQIHNHIRALSPKPGAYTFHHHKRVKLFKTIVKSDDSEFKVGTIIRINKHSFEVKTTRGVLEIFEVQPSGKNKIDAGLFAHNHLKVGDIFNNE